MFSPYAWVKPLKDEKTIAVFHGFIRIVNESNRKQNKVWVDKERKFYNSLM